MPKKDISKKRRNNRNNRPEKYKKLCAFDKGQVMAYHSAGLSMRKIAETINCPKSTVSHIMQNYNRESRITRKPGSGGKRKTTKYLKNSC